jgi:hypothetical protein
LISLSTNYLTCFDLSFTIPLISATPKAYRPPQARGTEASVKLHEYEAASDPTKKQNPGGM